MIFFDNNLGKLAPQFALHFKNKTCTTTHCFFFLSFFFAVHSWHENVIFPNELYADFFSLEQNRTQ